MKTNSKQITLLFLFSIAGCANVNSVYRPLAVSDGMGALIDIKQRAIIASTVPSKDSKGDFIKDQHGNIVMETRVCAEPSPDALSAYAAELAGKADTGKVAAGFTAAFQESSSFVGLRTQSIQLLRDASYRLCESYLSGAIDALNYQWMLRRFQRNMVVLLTVEQLTGTVRAPAITINTQGQAEAAKSLSEIQTEKDKADVKIKALEDANLALANDGEKNKEEIKKNQDDIDRLKANRNAMTQAISNARDLLASGSATATVSNVALVQQPSLDQIKTVADAVKGIVNDVLGADDMGQLCFNYLLTSNDKNQNKILSERCEQYFAGTPAVRNQPGDTLPDLPPHLKKPVRSINGEPTK